MMEWVLLWVLGWDISGTSVLNKLAVRFANKYSGQRGRNRKDIIVVFAYSMETMELLNSVLFIQLLKRDHKLQFSSHTLQSKGNKSSKPKPSMVTRPSMLTTQFTPICNTAVSAGLC